MTAADLHWHDLRTLTLEGQGWTDTRADYDRLPARAAGRQDRDASRCECGRAVAPAVAKRSSLAALAVTRTSRLLGR